MQDILDAMDGVSLVIGRDLVVRGCGRPNWTRFWQLNGGGPEVLDPVGHDVTGFITEGPVRNTYRLLMQRVLEDGAGVVRLDYRCDAPNLRRLMRLTLTPIGAPGAPGGLLYQSVLLSEAPRPPVPLIDRAPVTADRSSDVTRLCPVCCRSWLPALADPDRLDWAEPPAGPRDAAVPEVVHEFCPRCEADLFAQPV